MPWRRLCRAREWGLVLAVVLVVAVIAACGQGQVFLTPFNRLNLLRQIALLGVFAVGEAVVIIAGGIDLSVGSVIGFSGMMGALLLTKLAGGQPTDQPLPAVMLLAGVGVTLLLGLLIGMFHALLVTKLQLPPFIATLSTLAGLRSAAYLVTNSNPVTLPYPNFRALSDGLTPVWFFVVAALAVSVLMGATTLGRSVQALGGNEEAARLSGLRVDRLKYVTYGLSGLLAALAGVLYAAYSGQGDPRTGAGYELQAIAAAVVGGCSLTGGVGTVSGTVLGVVLLQVVLNGIGLVIKSNSTLWQGIVTGVVVVLAVTLNNARQRRLARSVAA
jgi:ribose/xylose/arabinose/galactoside ABC-type transport system permease subunit